MFASGYHPHRRELGKATARQTVSSPADAPGCAFRKEVLSCIAAFSPKPEGAASLPLRFSSPRQVVGAREAFSLLFSVGGAVVAADLNSVTATSSSLNSYGGFSWPNLTAPTNSPAAAPGPERRFATPRAFAHPAGSPSSASSLVPPSTSLMRLGRRGLLHDTERPGRLLLTGALFLPMQFPVIHGDAASTESAALALLEVLSKKVPGATLDQVVRLVGDRRLAVLSLGWLAKRRLIGSAEFVVRRTDLSGGPVFDSRRETLTLKRARKLEREMKARVSPPRTERVWFAGARFRRPSQVSHEIGVTEMYLDCRERFPEAHFVGERELPQRGAAVPDGKIVFDDGSSVALDFAPYRAHKLVRLTKGRDVILF